jgi:hypothetical protein
MSVNQSEQNELHGRHNKLHLKTTGVRALKNGVVTMKVMSLTQCKCSCPYMGPCNDCPQGLDFRGGPRTRLASTVSLQRVTDDEWHNHPSTLRQCSSSSPVIGLGQERNKPLPIVSDVLHRWFIARITADLACSSCHQVLRCKYNGRNTRVRGIGKQSMCFYNVVSLFHCQKARVRWTAMTSHCVILFWRVS